MTCLQFFVLFNFQICGTFPPVWTCRTRVCFCRDTGSIGGWSTRSSFKKPKHLLKRNVRVTTTSNFVGFAPKDSALKTEVFLFTLLLETERSADKKKEKRTIAERCFSWLCQNKSVYQKIAWSCKKWNIIPKSDILPFCMKAFNYYLLFMISVIASFYWFSSPACAILLHSSIFPWPLFLFLVPLQV